MFVVVAMIIECQVSAGMCEGAFCYEESIQILWGKNGANDNFS